ncbi:MAG TPA: ABC transporter permease [Terriglobia bacterium]|nr:ABC transporter permease [Terriglobia bacterium]
MAAIANAHPLLRPSRARERHGAGFRVSAREAFWIALEALRAHKLRSFLTLLGVVIATTTLIVVMSVINGMNLYIADHIANLGANVFILDRFNWANTSDEEWIKEQRRNKLIRMEDYQFLKDSLQGYKAIGASAWRGRNSAPEIRYKSHTLYEVGITGETPSMMGMEQEQVGSGRFFTEPEYEHSAFVCFIGQDLVNEFFPTTDPLDKVIAIGGQPFRVVGVAKTLGKTLGQSQDDFVQMPLTTFQKLYVSRPGISVQVQAQNADQMLELEDEVRALMRARHHVPYKESDDFGINASATIMGLWQQLTGSIFAITIAVVAVFMVVGGIVIMNIMLASVTERTHEIGIRKSLGARRRDILLQFVIESGVMAGVGGLAGVALAVVIAKLVDMVFTASVPLSAVLVGLTLSTVVGLFFGIYPATKAARLDPIEALRTEA